MVWAGYDATELPGHTYTITGLSAGTYQIRFYPSSPDYLMEYYAGAFSPATATLVAVTSGNDTPGIDAHLSAPAGFQALYPPAAGI